MNRDEEKIRKGWITLFLFMITTHFIQNLWLQPPAAPGVPDWVPRLVWAISTFGSLLFSYAMYRCIYRKPGTKLLTFLLYVQPISLGAMILFYAFGVIPIPPSSWAYKAYVVFDTALLIWWYTFSLKMLPLNRKLAQKT